MRCKIIGFENGPLEVDCADVVFIKDGKKIEAENPSHPCRCGHSKNKPWCDGSHAKVDFTSKREIEDEVIQEYEGKEITIHFNRSICAGAANCVDGLPSVFTSDSSTNWIYPDNDTNDKIIKTVKSCPSGALSYSIKGKLNVDKRTKAEISIVKNGPYVVEGVKLEGIPTPTNFSTTKYTLCRCGHSKNKPFCDYSHAENNWSDE